jgi:hypothetical protein
MTKKSKIVQGKLTDRDVALLNSMAEYRYLSVSQIIRLHFPSQQTANRRLRFLTGSSYLDAFQVPGISERIICLGKKGKKLLTNNVPYLLTGHKRPHDYHFLRHFMEISDFRINLEQSCSDSDVEMHMFIPEFRTINEKGLSLRSYLKDEVVDPLNNSREISHTPDGAFILIKNAIAALFFLEVDRGTEVIGHPDKGVLKAIRFYLAYLESGKYQRFAQQLKVTEFKGFRALWVIPTVKRIDNIKKVVTDLYATSSKGKQFVWLADKKELDNRSVLTIRWHSADIEDNNKYRIT